jgi:hypothetical protein
MVEITKMIKEQMTLVTGKYIILVSVFFSTREAKKSVRLYQEKFPNGVVKQTKDVIMVKYIQ